MPEDAIHHAWKALRAMSLSIDSPAASFLAGALTCLVELNGLIDNSAPSAIDAYIRGPLLTQIIAMKVVDSDATAKTVDDLIEAFREAGFPI
jgi:hypothetical protein